LFVAKTATPAQGNWARFWAIDVVMQHLCELYDAGPFRIDPDYGKVKTVSLTRDVAEPYAPVQITDAGSEAVPDDPELGTRAIRLEDGDRRRPADSVSAHSGQMSFGIAYHSVG
jgi:hypothetical protein